MTNFEKNVLVLGGTGLLGSQFVKFYTKKSGYRVVSLARKGADVECDISDSNDFHTTLENLKPDAIINCAALVDINICELRPNESWSVNVQPMFVLHEWARSKDFKLIQVSTDHFFDNGGAEAHSENDPVTFKNIYAKHKYCAEQIASLISGAMVLRTSILGESNYRANGSVFWEWALDAVLQDKKVSLFYDAFTSSIDIFNFCDLTNQLLEKNATGLLNLASSEVYSKKDFVLALAARLDRKLSSATTASVHQLEISRATCLGLDVTKIENILGLKMPNLEHVISSLLAHSERVNEKHCSDSC